MYIYVHREFLGNFTNVIYMIISMCVCVYGNIHEITSRLTTDTVSWSSKCFTARCKMYCGLGRGGSGSVGLASNRPIPPFLTLLGKHPTGAW